MWIGTQTALFVHTQSALGQPLALWVRVLKRAATHQIVTLLSLVKNWNFKTLGFPPTSLHYYYFFHVQTSIADKEKGSQKHFDLRPNQNIISLVKWRREMMSLQVSTGRGRRRNSEYTRGDLCPA
ncbi:hypothetical protein KIL84_000937 [Mauremys mutica]|uniref:Uncharacterized protein n=1 Tax=Mauremys mutica TaxID=74926 RepID=A0A9D3WZI5_9SAUR|nr:hypothetical protein KIL84_000937 [Mauremys mutica]